MWDAAATVPPPEQLAEPRMMRIPTPAALGLAVVRSALETAALLALLWPFRARLYRARLALAALAGGAWFVLTTPLGISRMEWVHRRWLFLVVAVLLLLAAVSALRSLLSAVRVARS